MPFEKIGLCEELVQGILATGYKAPTEIQAEAIPAAMQGRDIVACAQTGTGKTAAFVLPILNRIASVEAKTKKRIPRALIVTPTRELAVQVEKAVNGYGRFIKMYSVAIYGGTSIDRQCRILRKGVDVIVATPGRLIDHVKRGTVNLSAIEVLVLDEADLMLDMGFVNDIKQVIAEIPSDRQTLLFSATVSKQLSVLTKEILRSPVNIQIGKQHNPIETITQHIYPVSKEQKMELLLYMINSQQMYSVLVFSRTKRGADKICKTLVQNGIKADAIHSDRKQRQRQRTMDGFRSGKYQVMVATDVAARGINVEGISHVFNYDVPAYAEDYVHRIGRTGRAAATGDAITFVSYDEIPYLKKIEKFIDRSFTGEYLEDFEYSRRLNLNDGPTGEKSGSRKRVGSSQRRRMKAKAPAGRPRKNTDKTTAGKAKALKKTKPKSAGSSDKLRASKPKSASSAAKPKASKPKRKKTGTSADSTTKGSPKKTKTKFKFKPKQNPKSKPSSATFKSKKKKQRR